MRNVFRLCGVVLCGIALLLGLVGGGVLRAATTRAAMGDITFGQTVQGTMKNGDTHVYHLALAADSPLEVRYNPGTSTVLLLEVRSGSATGPVVGTVKNELVDKVLYLPLLPLGDYYIIVKHDNPWAWSFNYTLTVNNTLTASPITDPTLPAGGKTKVYAIPNETPGPLYIILQKPVATTTLLHLYKDSITGDPLKTDRDANSQLMTLEAGAGTYYLVVHTTDLKAPANSCVLTAGRDLPTLEMGTPAQAQITIAGQISLFRVDAVAGKPLYLSLFKDAPWPAYVEVRQGALDGTLVAQVDRAGDAALASPDQWFSVPVQTSGPYFIRVETFVKATAVSTPLTYTITVQQELPVLAASATVALPGTHSVRWYRLPATVGQPLFVQTDHNSDKALAVTLVKDGIAGTTVATVNGAGDQLLYQPSAAVETYYVKFSNSTMASVPVISGSHLPQVTGTAPASGAIANGYDIHWYEVPVAAGEEVVLHLDKPANYDTALPWLITNPGDAFTATGNAPSDIVEFLTPTAATTYFVRVAGEPGSYTLRANRTFTVLPYGQAVEAAPKHAGDERWFEVSSEANRPLFIATDKVKGTNLPVEVYKSSITQKLGTFGGTMSSYGYLPALPQATRYLLRIVAPAVEFTADSAVTLTADTSLPTITAGETKTGTLASQYQRRFFMVRMPAGRPMTLQGTLPIVIFNPYSGKTLNIGTRAAVAGLEYPCVIEVSAATAASYTLAATTDLSNAGQLYFSNSTLEARVDLLKTTVGFVKLYTGSNTYLNQDGAQAQYLHVPEGTEYSTGWTLGDAIADGDTLQLVWRHPAREVTKRLIITAGQGRGEMTCQVETPRPITFSNALLPPMPQTSTMTYAVPSGPVMSNTYATNTNHPVFPAVADAMSNPTERWAAFWNSAVNEVYGVTLGTNHQVALSTNGQYTVTRVLCPAGKSAFTVCVVRPKPATPYEAIRALAARPGLTISHAPDARLVPIGTPISATITVQNIGTSTASSVTATATLPEEVTYVADSAGTGATYDAERHTITWNVGALASGTGRSLTYQCTVNAGTPLEKTLTLLGTARSAEMTDMMVASCQVTTSGPSLTSVSPSAPGNVGSVTLTLQGACFAKDAVATFTQNGVSVPATTLDLSADRTRLRVLVDLSGRTGSWDVTVTNPGGGAVTLPGGIALASGGESRFWGELTGPPQVKIGQWQTITVQYGNHGSIDDTGRLLVVYIPFNNFATGIVQDDAGRTLATLDKPNSTAGPLVCWLPRIGPGETRTLYINIKAVARSRALGVLYPNISLLTCPMSKELFTKLAQQAVITKLQVNAADRTAMNALVTAGLDVGQQQWADAPVLPGWSALEETVKRVRADAKLNAYLIASDGETIGEVLDRMVEVVKAGGTDWPSLMLLRKYAPTINTTGLTQSKMGPVGVGTLGYLMAGQSFTYYITCRNPASSAAAQTASLTDTLDTALDWTTLRLGNLRIGRKIMQMTSGTLPYHGYVDLRPDLNAIADVTVSFDPVAGKLSWSIAGFNPVTSERTDVLLPGTDANGPLSEIAVEFNISPKVNLQSGVQIRNTAAISLDGATGLLTNTVTNAIDAQTPTSKVQALPAVQEDPNFTVSWIGEDEQNGSGLTSYTIYVSDNGGPYVKWKDHVTTQSAPFTTAVMGHTYRFYSIAEDAVGHVEATPTTPDATIKIGRDILLPRGTHLVSVPIVLTQTDPKAVLGFTGNKWARYIPGTGYVVYGNDPQQLTWFNPPASVPGRAYWGSWSANKLIEPDGEALPLTGTVNIELVAGWNMIGNPWTKALPWDPAAIKVKVGTETKTLAQAAPAGWVSDYGWVWEASTSSPTTGQYWMLSGEIAAARHEVPAWRGCWIKAGRACTLLLPAPNRATSLARTSGRRLFADGWQLRLVARTATSEDGFNWIGEGNAADAARARAILAPPPAFEPGVELSLDGGRVIDLHEPGRPATWRFTVTTPTPGETVTLSWPDMTGLPGDLALVLVDETTGARHYLRTTRDYQFATPTDGRPAAFHLETAARGALRIASLTARPGASRATGVNIAYTLTQSAAVTAEVRTFTGKLIRRLTGTGTAAGTLLWDGRDTAGIRVPPGTYLITLTATNTEGATIRAVTTCAVK